MATGILSPLDMPLIEVPSSVKLFGASEVPSLNIIYIYTSFILPGTALLV